MFCSLLVFIFSNDFVVSSFSILPFSNMEKRELLPRSLRIRNDKDLPFDVLSLQISLAFLLIRDSITEYIRRRSFSRNRLRVPLYERKHPRKHNFNVIIVCNCFLQNYYFLCEHHAVNNIYFQRKIVYLSKGRNQIRQICPI